MIQHSTTGIGSAKIATDKLLFNSDTHIRLYTAFTQKYKKNFFFSKTSSEKRWGYNCVVLCTVCV